MTVIKSIFDRFRVPALRPIMIVGAGLVVVAMLLAWVFLLRPGSPAFLLKLNREGIYFVTSVIGPVVLFYLLTGVGVLLTSKWGYRLFTAFLYVHLFVGFPITTVFAYRGLSYIKASSIRRYFGMSADGNGPTAMPRRSKITLALIGAALVALYVWVMVTF